MLEEEDKLIEELKRRIQYQMDHTWQNIFDNTVKSRFLNNFCEDDRIAGLVLLDILLYHNQAQEKALMKSVFRKMQSHMYKSNHPLQEYESEKIEKCLSDYISKSACIPVSD